MPRQLLRHPANFTGPGQEHQHRASLVSQDLQHHRRYVIHHPGIAGQGPIKDIHRKRPAFTGNHRHVPQHLGNGRGIQCRGHHQKAQVFSQGLLTLSHQCQPQIGLQGTLMEFVKQNSGIVFQHGVGLDQAGEYTLGHYFDPGGA